MEVDEHLKNTFIQFDPAPRKGDEIQKKRVPDYFLWKLYGLSLKNIQQLLGESVPGWNEVGWQEEPRAAGTQRLRSNVINGETKGNQEQNASWFGCRLYGGSKSREKSPDSENNAWHLRRILPDGSIANSKDHGGHISEESIDEQLADSLDWSLQREVINGPGCRFNNLILSIIFQQWLL